MKVLLLHISDTHFRENTYIEVKYAEKLVSALRTLDNFEMCMICYTGDITYSGKEKEYKKAGIFLSQLKKEIKKSFPNQRIKFYIVPGNHDINFKGTPRSRSVSRDLITNLDENIITKELEKFCDFYKFAEYNFCFKQNKIAECTFEMINGKKIQINLFNSDLFSTFQDKSSDDSKGLHYFSDEYNELLRRNNESDFVITLAHKGPEWFDYQSKVNFNKLLNFGTDIFLSGHEHITETQNSIIGENNTVKSIAVNMNFELENMAFTTLLLDTEKKSVQCSNFSWDNAHQLFKDNEVHNKPYIIKNTRIGDIMPNYQFVSNFLVDEKGVKLGNYFVFPDIEIKTSERNSERNSETILLEKLIDQISTSNCTIIEGDYSSGKTTLLKILYEKLQEKFNVIYLDENTIARKNIKKAIKSAFEEQYGATNVIYQKYIQLEKRNKVIFIDNFHKIEEKYHEEVLEYLKLEFEHIVIVTNTEQNFNFVDHAKETMDSSEHIRYKILPFYTGKRQELIRKILNLIPNQNTSVEEITDKIDLFIRNQIEVFSLNPRFIKMYVEYCMNYGDYDNVATTSFSAVFENNIMNLMCTTVNKSDLDEYLAILEHVAFNIHFKKLYPIQIKELTEIIIKYNDEYMNSIDCVAFCSNMVRSKIFRVEENNYYFYENTYLAYFVARALNNLQDKDTNNVILKSVLENICFSINDDILLFLYYTTKNLEILKYILDAAKNLMANWEEFNIDEQNISFLDKQTKILDISCPNSDDKKKHSQMLKEREKQVIEDKQIETVKIYDYNEEDINTDKNQLVKAIKLLELLCKILPAFSSRIKKDMKIEIVESLFSFPNKILYKILKPLDEEYEEISASLSEYTMKDGIHFQTNEIENLLREIAETFIYSVYIISVELSTTTKTRNPLYSFKITNTNHGLLKLLMIEHIEDFKTFAEEVEKLFNSSKTKILVQNIIKISIYYHFLKNKSMALYGDREAFAIKYLGANYKVNRFKPNAKKRVKNFTRRKPAMNRSN